MDNKINKIRRNINIALLILIFSFNYEVIAQTSTAPAGSGTSGDPYQIATLNNLYWLSQTTSAWAAGTYFIQTADINASTTSGWDGGAGFSPIGGDTEPTFFYGNYNGNGHTINGLYINRPSALSLGLFGTIANTTVQNLGVINVNINGGANNVGGLVGVNRDSYISKCYSTGTITSNATNVGGIIGYNNEYCTVSNSYSTISIVNNSAFANIGGLVGRNFDRSTVTNSYSAGSVTSSANNIGGFCGWNAGTITNSFWNSSIVSTGIGFGTTTGTAGKTTAEMKSLSTFTNVSWDFKGETTNGTNDIWGINGFDNNGYPFLSWQGYVVAVKPDGLGTSVNPYLIATLDNLYWITQNSSAWDKYYEQTANIDASSSSGWNGGIGFTPIGDWNSTYPFNGTYDGNGYKIDGIYFNSSTTNYVGLFGFVWDGVIKNLGVTNVQITANISVGGIIGIAFSSTIENCYSTGNVQGDSNVGGIVGYAVALGNINSVSPFNMTSCSSSAITLANNVGGGLIGYAQGTEFDSTAFNITMCNSTGSVRSTTYAGGLVGVIEDGTISKSCVNGGIVTILASGSGGLAAEAINSSISNSYVKNILNIGGSTNNGGLIGRVTNSTISNCYATYGLIIGSGMEAEEFHNGALIGIKYSGTINNSFSDILLPYISGGTNKTTTELKTNSTFLNAGWDPNIWYRDNSRNNGFPYLAWQNPSGTPLPVELTSLTANVDGNKVILNWETASEVNNYGFEIQRSVVGTTHELSLQWEILGFVEGYGNSNSPKQYTFTDDKTSEVLQNLRGFDGKLQYRLKQIDFDGKFEYSQLITVETRDGVSLPTQFALEQNYPNPFNPTTTIKYSIPTNVGDENFRPLQMVTLKVYDILGNEVATLVNEQKSAGSYEVNFNANYLSSGVYIYRLNAGTFNSVRKMLLIK